MTTDSSHPIRRIAKDEERLRHEIEDLHKQLETLRDENAKLRERLKQGPADRG